MDADQAAHKDASHVADDQTRMEVVKVANRSQTSPAPGTDPDTIRVPFGLTLRCKIFSFRGGEGVAAPPGNKIAGIRTR